MMLGKICDDARTVGGGVSVGGWYTPRGDECMCSIYIYDCFSWYLAGMLISS